MLGTLMKHEWNYMGKKFLLFLATIAVATVLGMLSFSGIEKLGDETSVIRSFLILSGLITYYGLIIVVSFGFVLLCGVRFYKNVFGDEAYITHTLPVTAREIHNSKVIVYGLCEILLTFALIFSLYMATSGITVNTLSSQQTFAANDLFAMFGMSKAEFYPMIIAMMIVSGFCNITITYCAIVLGQTWKKHKIVGAVIWYVILTFALSIVSTLASMPAFGAAISAELTEEAGTVDLSSLGLISTTFIVTTIVTLAFGIVAYLITDHGLTKKLNLE